MTPLRPGRRCAQRTGLIAAGLLLLGGAGFVLTPNRLLGGVIPTNTTGTVYNLSLVVEIRLFLALSGLLCLGAGLFPAAPRAWAGRLAPTLSAADRWLGRGRRWPALVLASAAATAALFAGYSIARHQAFNSKAYDLGLHAQVFWNTSHGRLFASSVEVGNYLGDHVSPIILLLTPIYWAWPDPRALLVLQAVALASGALPLALLTKRLLRPVWAGGSHLASLALALVFLSYPALGFVNRFEFHEEVLVVPLFLAAFWLLESSRPGWMSLALLLAMLCKEDIGLTVAAFGVFVAWRSRPFRRIGLAWAVVGVAWSLISLLVVIPALRGAPSDTLVRYAWLGTSPAEILRAALHEPMVVIEHTLGEPRRLWMLVKALLPTGFLAVFSPALLVALPGLAINWLAGNLYQSSIYFHYIAPSIPIVFAAAAHGLARTSTMGWQKAGGERTAAVEPSPSTLGPLLLLWLVACAALALSFDQFWQPATGPAGWENYSLQRTVDAEAFAGAQALLPADGAVATTEAFAAHLAQRQGLFLLHDPRILHVADQVDWVLVDLNDRRYGVEPKRYFGLLRWIAERRGLETCFFAGDVVLLGRDCHDEQADSAYRARLRELQQAVQAAPIDSSLVERLGQQYFTP